MKTYFSHFNCSTPTAVALGNFDGVHLGHTALINKLVSFGIPSLVYTFYDHPLNFIKGEGSVKVINTHKEKEGIFESLGVDTLFYEDFLRVKDMTPKEFVKSVLIDTFHAKEVVCGFNYRFGKNALCNAENLDTFFKNEGGSVQISEKIMYNDTPISSSHIRKQIQNGNVEELLSYMRPYSIYAMVEKGKGIGAKDLGFATINQQMPKGKVTPCTGVYITECEIGEDVYPAITNVGYRPTTDGENTFLNVETHIIGYSGNLYYSYLRVNFYKLLRPEKRFNSLDELKNQIEADKKSALEYFGYNKI
jgi:riboflavin kinase/FMN adenylyltransferase